MLSAAESSVFFFLSLFLYFQVLCEQMTGKCLRGRRLSHDGQAVVLKWQQQKEHSLRREWNGPLTAAPRTFFVVVCLF